MCIYKVKGDVSPLITKNLIRCTAGINSAAAIISFMMAPLTRVKLGQFDCGCALLHSLEALWPSISFSLSCWLPRFGGVEYCKAVQRLS